MLDYNMICTGYNNNIDTLKAINNSIKRIKDSNSKVH